ncbi:aminoglycoside phosphotransferase [Terrabacter sp. MAHUQ-38]|uniref:maltokinase N-terminal cap-like domain-containing protein n=1 Tax=unclassified Terrabacter TaxID=2630222 RepID=UPI00165E1BED|nr:aminoglycoside phosphotransferase [Terrabacter sp. MAHUQ-38]MBC9821607.1 aminoglycoside phosphotransferase [Terrabacter sp. MAHUQ-38]
MAIVHKGASLVPTKTELVTEWMPQQRWYHGKGHVPRLRRVGGFRFEDPEGEVGCETLLLADEAVEPAVVYQVPLTYRPAPLEGAEHALLGTMEHSVLGTRWVYDGPHDPVYVSQLMATILGAGVSDEAQASVGSNALATGSSTGHADGSVSSSTVLSGEQSNTSVICRMAARDGGPAEPVIVKVFRTVQDGDNPDVVVQSALTREGSDRVPMAIGHLAGAWDAPAGGPGLHGHLAFAQEFIPGVEDAWRVALVAAASATDFTTRARELGVVTAQIHTALAHAFGTSEVTPEARDALAASMRQRYAAAVALVPDLASHGAAVDRVVASVRDVHWPPLQRIHGDYHLGQVLDVPERGWVALDFEGEPLRPLSERTQPDLTARDVAGMLRSFDYAAGSVALAASPVDATAWAAACREAFLDGYSSVVGRPDADAVVLTRALELDKALYEVVYEARNRPSWLPIPLGAVERLISAEGTP